MCRGSNMSASSGTLPSLKKVLARVAKQPTATCTRRQAIVGQRRRIDGTGALVGRPRPRRSRPGRTVQLRPQPAPTRTRRPSALGQPRPQMEVPAELQLPDHQSPQPPTERSTHPHRACTEDPRTAADKTTEPIARGGSATGRGWCSTDTREHDRLRRSDYAWPSAGVCMKYLTLAVGLGVSAAAVLVVPGSGCDRLDRSRRPAVEPGATGGQPVPEAETRMAAVWRDGVPDVLRQDHRTPRLGQPVLRQRHPDRGQQGRTGEGQAEPGRLRQPGWTRWAPASAWRRTWPVRHRWPRTTSLSGSTRAGPATAPTSPARAPRATRWTRATATRGTST